MFAAWQAGAWKALEQRVRPDLVVGASAGCLNAWGVAGGCTGQELERYWMESAGFALRLRFPRHPLHGWLDGREIEKTIRRFHGAWRPRIEYSLVLTDVLRLKPRLFDGAQVTAEHLLASCAVPPMFDQRMIEGRLYSDGGLLNPCPVWAAIELGAERVIALDSMPEASWRKPRAYGANVIHLAPRPSLGPIWQILAWRGDRIRRWIDEGYEAAAKAAL